MTVEKAKQIGVCLALVKNATCGKPLRNGKCRKHGENVYRGFKEHHEKLAGGK